MQQLQPGALLQGGKYRIVRVLGQGGFGNKNKMNYYADKIRV